MSDYHCDTCIKTLNGEELYTSHITCKECHAKRIERLGRKLNEAMETLMKAKLFEGNTNIGEKCR